MMIHAIFGRCFTRVASIVIMSASAPAKSPRVSAGSTRYILCSLGNNGCITPAKTRLEPVAREHAGAVRCNPRNRRKEASVFTKIPGISRPTAGLVGALTA